MGASHGTLDVGITERNQISASEIFEDQTMSAVEIGI